MNLSEIRPLIFIWQVFLPAKVIFAGVRVLLSVCKYPFYNFVRVIVMPISLRQQSIFG